MNKKDLSERDICSKFIGPAVKRAGWDGMMQIREEVNFTKGRIIVRGNPPFGGREEDGIESNFPKHFQTRETADLFLAFIIRILKSDGRAAVVLPDGALFGEGVKTRLKEHLMEECNLHTIVRLPNSVFKSG